MQNCKPHEITGLIELRGRIKNSDDRNELSQAIQGLAKALAAKLWVDETHLQTNYGVAVFYAGKDSVDQLGFILRDRQNKSSKEQLPGFIRQIVNALRVLAIVAVDEASSAKGDPQEIKKARKSLAQAEGHAAAGHYESAIDCFSLAWEQACDSRDSSCRAALTQK